jgi:group I intron endonuclease
MTHILNTHKPYDVYMLTSTGNPDKVYIGYTGGGYQQRFKEHLYEAVDTARKQLEDPTFKGRWLISAINKYGADSFKTTRINSYTTEEEAKAAEILWIAQFKPKGKAWNMTDGGDGTSGYIPTAEQRAEMSAAREGAKNPMYGVRLLGENNPMYGKCHTDEARAKQSEAKKGKTLSDKHKAKLSESRIGEKNHTYGKPRPDEVKAKISNSRVGQCTGANNPNYKYDPVAVADCASAREAGIILGISPSQYTKLKKAHPELAWPSTRLTKKPKDTL